MGELEKLGIQLASEPQGAFYVWADLSGLPENIQDGISFFREGLKEKVITVPGVFFDVNPGATTNPLSLCQSVPIVLRASYGFPGTRHGSPGESRRETQNILEI